MKSHPYALVGILVLLAALGGSPALGSQTILESGDFQLAFVEKAWFSTPIEPALDGAAWAAFFVDAGLDVMMSNGQLLSNAFETGFTGYICCLWQLNVVTLDAASQPTVSNPGIDLGALQGALDARLATLDAVRLELLETDAGGQQSIPLELDVSHFSLRVTNLGSSFGVSPHWDLDPMGYSIESDSTYRFRITTTRCSPGTVNAANDFVTNVLYVDGSSGGADRTVEITEGDAVPVSVLLPLAGGNGRFVLHGNEGDLTSVAPSPLPFDIGTTCFPFLLTGGASPVIVANNLGKTDKVGASRFYGTTTPDPQPATVAFFYPDLALGTVITFQGVIVDPGSSSSRGVSTTNCVTLRIVP